MISVIARSFAGGHEMRAACDIPEDLTKAALETLDRRFTGLASKWMRPRTLTDFGEFVLMMTYQDEAKRKETRLAADAAAGVTHHHAGPHFRVASDRTLIVQAVIGGEEQRPWAVTQSIAGEIFRGLASRLAVNRIETVEEVVCRTVFDALQDVILEQKKSR